MRSLDELILSMVTYLLVGYLAGMTLGLTLVDPNLDLYALLGLVLALVGMLLGFIPFFRRRVPIAFGVLIGFYVGMIISVLIWGNAATDDLLEILQRGGPGLIFSLLTALAGGYFASRMAFISYYLPALALLVGGFIGGLFFITIGAAPHSSMVGTSPFVLGSGIICGLTVWRLKKNTVHKDKTNETV